jgi:shikimate kinase
VRVLLTGMSGVGKSTLVRELRRRGYEAYDADDDGFSESRADGRWGWRADKVAALLDRDDSGVMFFAGCSEEQATLPFDFRVLLTAPRDVLLERLSSRSGNDYGRDERERQQVLADLDEVEPLLRRSADRVLDTTAPTASVGDELLRNLPRRVPPRPSVGLRPAVRVALVTAVILLIPLAGMLVGDGVDWGVADFVFAALLLGGAGLLLELAVRKPHSVAVRTVAIAIGIAAIVLGNADDAPGLMLFGGMLILGMVALALRTA